MLRCFTLCLFKLCFNVDCSVLMFYCLFAMIWLINWSIFFIYPYFNSLHTPPQTPLSPTPHIDPALQPPKCTPTLPSPDPSSTPPQPILTPTPHHLNPTQTQLYNPTSTHFTPTSPPPRPHSDPDLQQHTQGGHGTSSYFFVSVSRPHSIRHWQRSGLSCCSTIGWFTRM